MKRIVMLPLDERPCNFNYPGMMPKTDCELVLPPKEIMGKKKVAGDSEKIAEWLLSNVKDADAMVLSLDTLVYGGIVPSRLHHETSDELMKRADLIKKLRELNPSMKLYVFGLIMRCPKYSSSDEERLRAVVFRPIGRTSVVPLSTLLSLDLCLSEASQGVGARLGVGNDGPAPSYRFGRPGIRSRQATCCQSPDLIYQKDDCESGTNRFDGKGA